MGAEATRRRQLSAELRAAIWAAPDDLAAYRVYADWLLEHGSSHGEYIQLALIGEPNAEQARRKKALLKQRGDWLGAARSYVRSWNNDRFGFAATVVCEAQKLAAGYQALLDTGPRARLEVTSFAKRRRATVREVSGLPLGRFHAISLSSGLDDADLEMLAPALAGIRRLDLGHNSFTAAGIRAVGAHVGGIETLSIVSHNYAPDWIDAIVDTPGFASLKHVVVHGTDLRVPVPVERLQNMPAIVRVNPPRPPGAPTLPMDPAEP